MVLAPDVEKNLDTLRQVVDPWIRGRLLGALATTVEGQEVLELCLEGKFDRVSIHFAWSTSLCARL